MTLLLSEYGGSGLPRSGPEPDLRGADASRVLSDVYIEQAPRLLGYLTRQVGAHLAEEILSETFHEAWRERSKFDPDAGPLVGWLYGIATVLIRGHRRTWARESALLPRLIALQDRPAGSAEDHADVVAGRVDAASTVGELADAVARLSPQDRDVLLLSAWAQLSHAEIATALDIPVGTVRSRMHRVRRHLLAS